MISQSTAFRSANLAMVKRPIHMIIIEGYSRVFTNRETNTDGQYSWIVSIDDLQITVADLDGGANLGNLAFTVQDHGGAITADFPALSSRARR